MATSKSKRTAAPAPVRAPVKASILVDADLHIRWGAAASLRGMERGAYAVEVLREATKGIVLFDRALSKIADEVDPAEDEERAA